AVGGDQFFDQLASTVFTVAGEEVDVVGLFARSGRGAALSTGAEFGVGPLAVAVRRARLVGRRPTAAAVDGPQVVLEGERRARFVEADDADDRHFAVAVASKFGERRAPLGVFFASPDFLVLDLGDANAQQRFLRRGGGDFRRRDGPELVA